MAPCSAMICQQVPLSGDAEWLKVADAVIEAGGIAMKINLAHLRDQGINCVVFDADAPSARP